MEPVGDGGLGQLDEKILWVWSGRGWSMTDQALSSTEKCTKIWANGSSSTSPQTGDDHIVNILFLISLPLFLSLDLPFF